MKVVTPEIAWHETLPIYSCDLQPLPKLNFSTSGGLRSPLAELPLENFVCPAKGNSENLITKATKGSEWTRLATAGGDNMIRLWKAQLGWSPPSSVTVAVPTKRLSKGLLSRDEASGQNCKPGVSAGSAQKVLAAITDGLIFLATLKRHERLVNVVRWSSSGAFLASAGDDQFVIIWALQQSDNVDRRLPPGEVEDTDEQTNIEVWVPCRSLRRHLEDVYDLCWSPDDCHLLSGSVDQSAIIWQLDLSSGSLGDLPTQLSTASSTKAVILRDHKHYVQGVAWDPQGKFFVTMSSDRTCRIYRAGTKAFHTSICKVGSGNAKQHLFQDDSWKSFFRRPTFSPDGLLLICPAGNLESAVFAGDIVSSMTTTSGSSVSGKADKVERLQNAPQHAAHIFLAPSFTRPCVSLPTGPRPVVGVRFCPCPFHLRTTLLEDGLLFYDTQQTLPFAHVGQIHYQALNDVTWSVDGRLVVVCSTDGYCSLVHFAEDELGKPYKGPLGPVEELIQQEVCNPPMDHTSNVSNEKISLVMESKENTEKNAILPELVSEDKLKAFNTPPKPLMHPARKRITFQSGATPNRPHATLPVTPDTGRFLTSQAIVPEINGSIKSDIASEGTQFETQQPPVCTVFAGKRRVSFITLDSNLDGHYSESTKSVLDTVRK